MPTIQITSEQAAALARGENITIKPPSTPLHNVLLTVRRNSRTTIYVWDGEIRADGRIFASRYQFLTNVFGDPCGDDVRTPAEPLHITNADDVYVIQVGA